MENLFKGLTNDKHSASGRLAWPAKPAVIEDQEVTVLVQDVKGGRRDGVVRITWELAFPDGRVGTKYHALSDDKKQYLFEDLERLGFDVRDPENELRKILGGLKGRRVKLRIYTKDNGWQFAEFEGLEQPAAVHSNSEAGFEEPELTDDEDPFQ